MPLSPEHRALLALHLVHGIGPRLCAALVETFGTPARVLEASADELASVPHISAELARRLRASLHAGDVDAELARAEQLGVELLFAGASNYPERLGQIDKPPTLLYMKGTLKERDRRAIAVVGSRSCTAYGRRVAERLAGDLARAGWTVVSGLARGIDGCAHQGALRAGGRTLAVLAGGLAKIYPPEHAGLAEEVRATGALISEACLLMEPMPGMFPSRNRIISGLSQAVVVVEAAVKSGALITAEHALAQGREVFAVPGPVDSPASGGTLELIRAGARVARHAGDILEDLEGIAAPPAPVEAPPNLDPVEQALWQFLEDRPRNVDDLGRHVHKTSAELAALLMTMELKRLIRRLPGNLYERA